jgi:hypothetical protein
MDFDFFDHGMLLTLGKDFCDMILARCLANRIADDAERPQIRPNRNRIRTIINIVPTMPEGP